MLRKRPTCRRLRKLNVRLKELLRKLQRSKLLTKQLKMLLMLKRIRMLRMPSQKQRRRLKLRLKPEERNLKRVGIRLCRRPLRLFPGCNSARPKSKVSSQHSTKKKCFLKSITLHSEDIRALMFIG